MPKVTKTTKVSRIYNVENLGETMKQKRKKTGLSVREIAKIAGISRQYLSLIENDKIEGVVAYEKLEAVEIAIEKALSNQKTINLSVEELLNTSANLA